ncbi:MAG: ATP-binding protein, partial [Verrucomicrobiota bacterium]|nr:ATP-binding protein [Verrucomicrobiota bacterium]
MPDQVPGEVLPPTGGDSAPSLAATTFRALFESAPGLYLVLTPEEFTIVAVSDAYLRATMTERSAIIGRKLFQVFPDDPNDPAADGVRNLRTSLEAVKTNRQANVMAVQRYPVRRPEQAGGGFEERFWSPINSPVFGDDGQLAFIIHRVEDVTSFVRGKEAQGKGEEGWRMLESRAQHMEAEIALRAQDRLRADELQRSHELLQQSEASLRQLADAMPQIVWMARPDGYLDYYNSRWYEFTGIRKGAGEDEGWMQILHPDDVEVCTRRWYESVETGKPYEIRYRFLERRSGAYRWFLGRALPVRDEWDQIVRWYGTCTDIDDLVRAEDTARRAKEDAERANRAKDNFLAALSHELRTPLMPVLMCAAALEQEPAIEPEIRQQLGMMRRNVELEARLIDDLLDLTKVSRGKLQLQLSGPVDVHSLLIHTEQIVGSDARDKSVNLHLALAASEHHVAGDAARLHQVFWNLLNNAIKFTPAGGRINVHTTNPAPGQLVLTVDDTGAGIDQQTLPVIFRAFEQGNKGSPLSSGLGLGLSISKAIVELHGGTICAESPGPGLGTLFTIELATVLPFPSAQAAGAQPQLSDSRLQRLLLVEDHEPTLVVLSGLLRRHGYDVITANS